MRLTQTAFMMYGNGDGRPLLSVLVLLASANRVQWQSNLLVVLHIRSISDGLDVAVEML